MIAAVVLAVALGVLATYALTGKTGEAPGLPTTFVLGLPALAVAGAGFTDITLPWAVGAAVAVALGLLLAPRMPVRRGPFAAAVAMTVGLVMAAGVVRWLVPLVADLTGLNAWFLALATIAAAAAWAAGGRSTIVRTVFWLSIAAAVLLLVAGVVAGAPTTLAAPLLESDQTTVSGALWLVALFVFCLMHPAPGRSAAGAVVVGVALLLGLLGLLSVLGGLMSLPSTGLFTIAGYASFKGATAGTVLALPMLLVAAVATGAAMRASLAPWEGFSAPGKLSSPALRIVIVASLVGLFTFAVAPISSLVAATAVAGVVALVIDRRSEPASAQPVAPEPAST